MLQGGNQPGVALQQSKRFKFFCIARISFRCPLRHRQQLQIRSSWPLFNGRLRHSWAGSGSFSQPWGSDAQCPQLALCSFYLAVMSINQRRIAEGLMAHQRVLPLIERYFQDPLCQRSPVIYKLPQFINPAEQGCRLRRAWGLLEAVLQEGKL